MMDFGLGMSVLGLILLVLFWAALLTIAIWLLGILFPAGKSQKNDNINSPKG